MVFDIEDSRYYVVGTLSFSLSMLPSNDSRIETSISSLDYFLILDIQRLSGVKSLRFYDYR